MVRKVRSSTFYRDACRIRAIQTFGDTILDVRGVPMTKRRGVAFIAWRAVWLPLDSESSSSNVWEMVQSWKLSWFCEAAKTILPFDKIFIVNRSSCRASANRAWAVVHRWMEMTCTMRCHHDGVGVGKAPPATVNRCTISPYLKVIVASLFALLSSIFYRICFRIGRTVQDIVGHTFAGIIIVVANDYWSDRVRQSHDDW